MGDTLFPKPRRRIGQAEALLAKSMRAWNEAGILTGASWASARGVLRDAARAVDAARADMLEGEGTAYSFARTNELYRQAMAAYQNPEGGTANDDLDAWLASLGTPQVRDQA